MKKFLKPIFVASSLILGMATFTSCGEDTGVGTLPGGEENPKAPTLKVTYNNQGSPDRNITVLAKPGGTANVNVHFEDNDPEKGNMYRLYITKNEYGVDDSFVPFKYTTAKIINPDGTEQTINVDLKRDGSIDLGKIDKKSFTFNMNLPAASDPNGTIQYVFWATKARGDFRDISNDNALPNKDYGTIAVKSSQNANAQAKSYREFSAKLLYAPTGDKTSVSFISVYNGETYKINDEEFGAFWDFGYYYGGRNKASFVSTKRYDQYVVNANTGKPVLGISQITGISQNDLNTCFFAKSSKDATYFDSVTSGAELDFISKTSMKDIITKMNVGDIVEFIDKYGNKGLIKINKIKGTYNQGDYIDFDVKVQTTAEPITL